MDIPNNNSVQVEYLGSLTRNLLSNEHSATIFGINSRGIFLKFDNNKMIFLSFEKYRGPLTANIKGDIQLLSTCSPGETINISRDGILFSDSGLHISTSEAKIWNPPLLMESPLDSLSRKNLIVKLASDVIQLKSSSEMSDLLSILTGLPLGNIIHDNHLMKLQVNIEKIRNQITKSDLISLFHMIHSFLGLGSGLTPSGDDFVIGLLLSLNRWGNTMQLNKDLPNLNHQMVEAAYKRTTTISANLIECATLGLSDERLIQAVDFLATGKNIQSEIINGLRNWGSSSGVDALVGMIVVFLPT